ncbi:MAG TPA: uroporphyrinogen decarboxylase family protein [Thermoleophilia bacterium]|nr:uroporphyrinogen decarboxylase family protein [Thermoleophilia bacterium]
MAIRTDQMTGLERIVAAMQFKEADQVPAGPLVCAAARRVLGISYQEWAQDADLATESMVQAQKLIGMDGVLLLVDLSVEAADFGAEMVYPLEDTPHPVYGSPLIKTVEDYKKLEHIDPRKTTRMRYLQRYTDGVMKAMGDRTAVMTFLYGPLGILAMLRSAEKLFLDCMKSPDEVIAACRIITDVLLEQIDALGETGAHAIVLDTLFASGSIMSKDLWKKMEGPFTTEIADRCRKNNMLPIVHNCGNNVYFDVQIEAMDPAAISFAWLPDDCKTPEELKEKYGDKVCLIGYMPPSPDMILHTPQQVKEACKEQIRVLGPGGGYILSTGCEFPPNGPLLNAIAMMEAAEEYGRYPLS